MEHSQYLLHRLAIVQNRAPGAREIRLGAKVGLSYRRLSSIPHALYSLLSTAKSDPEHCQVWPPNPHSPLRKRPKEQTNLLGQFTERKLWLWRVKMGADISCQWTQGTLGDARNTLRLDASEGGIAPLTYKK